MIVYDVMRLEYVRKSRRGLLPHIFPRVSYLLGTASERYNILFCLDINECIRTPEVCHHYANCTNIDGSYSCQCAKGFSGNGKVNCTGNAKREVGIPCSSQEK